jgi:Arc/MetJ family transcription regulator
MSYTRAYNDLLGGRARNAAPDTTLLHEGCVYPFHTVQHLFEAFHIPYKSVLLLGEPGAGKTHMARNLLGPILQKIHQADQIKISYNNLGDFINNMVDFKYFPWIENNSAVWKRTALVNVNQEAETRSDLLVLNVFDEVSRLREDAQNYLLPVLEDNQHRGFLLSHIGEMITIKRSSAIVCLANPAGNGTYSLAEALLDRVCIIHIDMPPAEMLAKITGEFTRKNSAYKSLGDLIPLQNIALDEEARTEVIACFGKVLRLSYRAVKEILFWLTRSPFPRRRLLEYVYTRQKLGMLHIGDEPLLEWVSYDLPEMLELLEIFDLDTEGSSL